MPRDRIEKAHAERNEALVEAMLLAAASDGGVSGRETDVMLRRVLERPEFEGFSPERIGALIETCSNRLAATPDLKHVLSSLRERLRTHGERLLAFGLAAAVAFADRQASRAELGLLKTFQGALGISEEEVVRVIEVVERGGSLADALGDRPERLFAEVMVLMSAADGRLQRPEAKEMVETLVGDPQFKDVSPEAAEQFVADAVLALSSEGLGGRLEALARGLSSREQRLKAYRLALRVARASGSSSPQEQLVLDLIQATFGLADDEVAKLKAH